jgi:hypothetical protein
MDPVRRKQAEIDLAAMFEAAEKVVKGRVEKNSKAVNGVPDPVFDHVINALLAEVDRKTPEVVNAQQQAEREALAKRNKAAADATAKREREFLTKHDQFTKEVLAAQEAGRTKEETDIPQALIQQLAEAQKAEQVEDEKNSSVHDAADSGDEETDAEEEDETQEEQEENEFGNYEHEDEFEER